MLGLLNHRNYEIINVYGFKPLNLWQLVAQHRKLTDHGKSFLFLFRIRWETIGALGAKMI